MLKSLGVFLAGPVLQGRGAGPGTFVSKLKTTLSLDLSNPLLIYISDSRWNSWFNFVSKFERLYGMVRDFLFNREFFICRYVLLRSAA